jgi:hypothetical protein
LDFDEFFVDLARQFFFWLRARRLGADRSGAEKSTKDQVEQVAFLKG